MLRPYKVRQHTAQVSYTDLNEGAFYCVCNQKAGLIERGLVLPSEDEGLAYGLPVEPKSDVLCVVRFQRTGTETPQQGAKRACSGSLGGPM
jgi:hypothetical protein